MSANTSSKESAPDGEVKEASLLGIPRELRLQIYDLIFASDVQYTVWREVQHYGFQSVPTAEQDPDRLIPWLSLMRSCKTIAIELRSVMREPAFAADQRNVTYAMDIGATRGGGCIGPTTWRQLPCAPNQVQYVEATYNASTGFRYGGDGGVCEILVDLWQTLNHLLHCGPRLDHKHQLATPMHLKELRIKVEQRGPIEPMARRSLVFLFPRGRGMTEAVHDSLCGLVRSIVETSVLCGFVEKVQVSSEDRVFEMYPAETQDGSIPDRWRGHSFEWGMDKYQGFWAQPDEE